jgi:DedD protein
LNAPRTHYQVSLTSRQALGLFLGLLAAIGLAYFLGVMTGLADRGEPSRGDEALEAAAAAPEPTETVPVPVRGVEPGAAARPSAEPTAAPAAAGEPETIQAFDDRPSGAPSETPAARAPTAAAVAAGDGFWVQVYSLSNASEARQRSVSLASRGYASRVSESTGRGGKLWRVRVGPYATREQADAAAKKLGREEKTETWIVPQGQ